MVPMHRRSFIRALAATPFIRPACADEPEWQTRLITTTVNGQQIYGLHIKLAPGWKTYWRVPGEAGIPPLIKLEGTGAAAVAIDYPLPIRIIDESGEAIGYHDEVVFIVRPTPQVKDAKLSAFFGVCKNICRPAKFEASLTEAVIDDSTMQKFFARLPVATDFISKARLNASELVLDITQKLDDIFIDGPDGLYFRKPTITDTLAKFKVDGLADGQSLKGEKLKITASANGKGLEQVVVVS
jgi:DsbC/DsbD-like thiol-disulfide interchange protein